MNGGMTPQTAIEGATVIEKATSQSAAPADHLPKLLPHHLAQLRSSGLKDTTITAAGIYSETNPRQLTVMLGWRKPTKGLAPALVFPFTGLDGRSSYCRIRPDAPRKVKKKPVKYESPRGQANRIYLPPGIPPFLVNVESELVFTEGEKKALAATQAGFPCVGLVGVYGFKAKGREALLPDLECVTMDGRRVFIAFDSDLERNLDVQSAETRFAKLLSDRGAIVRCVRLPDGPPDADGRPTKIGLDDFLLAHGPGELRKLLDSAIEPDAVEGAEGKQLAALLDPAEEAAAFLEADKHDGVFRLRHYRGSMLGWIRGKYVELPLGDVRAHVVRYLNRDHHHLTSSVVGNVLDQIRSQALLPFSVEPPAWIDGAEGWPADEILVTKNEMVHLPSVESGANYTRPLTPKFFTFSALDYEFQREATKPALWEWFLESLFGDDPESIELLRQWFGYCLLPNTRMHKILLLVGPKRGGKGTICRILTRLLGATNVCNPTLGSLADRFGLWPLIGKLLAVVSDARISGRADQAAIVERLLSVSGEDSQTIDRKNLLPWNGTLPTRFMICTNDVPRLADTSGALASRMIVIQLRQSFYGKEKLDLTDQLLGELPAILLWAIGGWQTLQQQKRFTEPQSGLEVAGELADLGSPVSVFLRERCRLGPEYSVPRQVLYEAYQQWSQEKGRGHVEDEAGFGRQLRAAYPDLGTSQPRVDGEKVRFHVGVQLV
ncbi:MAG TPA: phage/plasmid primase, P4 family [Pirellulales bacterium]|jgi:putative DNA primase/helicase|nr:phage/plasmid primase, P4 family [Pirellulales bacterium]